VLFRSRVDFDPDKETFISNDTANEMLSKRYRDPYGLRAEA
jgi:hypothetical protein